MERDDIKKIEFKKDILNASKQFHKNKVMDYIKRKNDLNRKKNK